MIHSTAIVSPNATIGENTTIGPYCVIEDGVVIGANNVFHSNVIVQGATTIGDGNEFFPFSAIGTAGQSYVHSHESPALVIGDRNVFRENTTIHCSTVAKAPTTIGNDNYFLCYSHVAHDCQVGNNCTLSHSAGISGFVVVEDHAIVSAMSGAHQFVRIGAHSITGGLAKIVKDVPPYMIADGNPATIRGVNTVGLKRKGFASEDIRLLKEAYKMLFLKKDINFGEALEELRQSNLAQNQYVKYLIEFAEPKEAVRGLTH